MSSYKAFPHTYLTMWINSTMSLTLITTQKKMMMMTLIPTLLKAFSVAPLEDELHREENGEKLNGSKNRNVSLKGIERTFSRELFMMNN